MRYLVALSVFVLLAPAAWPQQVPLAQPASRPCPALLKRVDHWIATLGTPISGKTRRQVHARLLGARRAGVSRMAAALIPTHTRQLKAQAADSPQASNLLTQLLDLIELLGRSRSPLAYYALANAAGQTKWTNTLRKSVLRALGKLSDPRALPQLAQLLQDQELGYTAGKAILAIERFEAVPHWIELLDSHFQALKTSAHDLLIKWSGERLAPSRKKWRFFFRQYPEGFKKLPGYKSGS